MIHLRYLLLAVSFILILVLAVRPGDAQPDDIIVDSDLTYTDTVLFLANNLTVIAGGALTLVNTSIIFNCTYPGQYGILVDDGGSLTIRDGDGDRASEWDASSLTGTCTFFLDVRYGSSIEMHNSIITRCGQKAAYLWDMWGVHIGASDFVIDGMAFSDAEMGLYLDDVTSGSIRNCTFDRLGIGIAGYLDSGLDDLLIVECQFSDLTQAIHLYMKETDDYIEISGNHFENVSKEVILVENARFLIIQSNDFMNNSYAGVYLKGEAMDGRINSKTLLYDNVMYGTNYPIILQDINDVRIEGGIYHDFEAGISFWSMFTTSSFHISSNRFSLGGTGIDFGVTRISDVLVTNNSFSSLGIGIVTSGGPIRIQGNYFEGMFNTAIKHEGSGTIEVLDNTFQGCAHGVMAHRILLSKPGASIDGNTFRDNDVGILVRDVQPLTLRRNLWCGDKLGLSAMGSSDVLMEDLDFIGCVIAMEFRAMTGTLRNLTLTDCGEGTAALLGTTITLDGAVYDQCDVEVSVTNSSEVRLLDCVHQGRFVIRDATSRVMVLWTAGLELLYASDSRPASGQMCELITSGGMPMGIFSSDDEGRIGPMRILQSEWRITGCTRNIPCTVNVHFRAVVHPFIVPFQGERLYILEIDDVPPVLTIMAPEWDSGHNRTPVMFRSQLSDEHSGVREALLFIDGVLERTIPSPPAELLLDMHVPDGRQTIRLVVTDMWLNSEDSSVEFYVDTQPPEVWVEAPTNGTLTNGTSILVHGEVVGASRILADGITLQLDGETFWGEVDLPQEGPNRVLIVAEDELANRALVELIIIRDTTPPRLTLTPLPSLVNYTMVEVIGWTDGGFLAIAPMNTSTMVEGDFRLTVELRPGPNTIRIVVSDAVGNIVNGSLECNLDTMVLFEVVSPKNGESVDGHEVILIGRTEPGMLLTVNGNAPMQWTVDDMTGDFNVTLELARYGLNTFLFTLEDPAGNTIVYHYSLNRQGMPNPTSESIHPAVYAILIVAVGAITVAGLLARRLRHG